MKTQKVYKVRRSVVKRFDGFEPLPTVRNIPAVEGFEGISDPVTLQPGEELWVLEDGNAERFTRACIRNRHTGPNPKVFES